MLFCIIFIGFILRVTGIHFGLPFQFHQDEPIVVNHALGFGSGDFNPHFFAIPPFVSYVLFFIYAGLFIAGKFFGIWRGAEDFICFYFKDPSIFYLIGRFFIGVLPGTLSVAWTYRLARRFLSRSVSIYSAAIMSVSFLNVINAHYIYTDMFLVLFAVIAYESFFRIYKKPFLKNYVISGVLVGFAASVKYNGIMLVFPYLLTHIFTEIKNKTVPKKIFFSRFLWSGIFSAFAVIIFTNPFSVITPAEFKDSFLKQAQAFWYMGFTHHISYSLYEGISHTITAFGIIGLILMVIKDKFRGMIFCIFPIVFYMILVFSSQPFPRYVLLLVPFLSIGGAYFLFSIFKINEKLGSNKITRILNIVIAILFLVPTVSKSIKADILFCGVDTRVESAEWIKNNLEPGSKIAFDSTFFRPALKQPYQQIERKKEFLKNQPGMKNLKRRKLELMIKAAKEENRKYPFYFLFDTPEGQGQFLETLPALPLDVNVLKKEGIEYIVINTASFTPGKEKFLEDIDEREEAIKEFSPYLDRVYRRVFDEVELTCLPVNDLDVYNRVEMGPPLRIYKIISKKINSENNEE
ncbi:family glycosyltransferase, 4-amino-4-deoxy-L-arabinose transferase [Candidatus Omnitrophus magneticus]|uniref:Family glycosyltransferase, 4-amino-4-deoxy-L-arabinose transferase n=1 Tax=Candidatus Omnitrophus magneticus TaxID=1609969 RepID=A0A0F0CUJ8_9BACT|nr:family glycosyltransferase, 4-amino-4-deoxy-L-arabinose transferase [Candidatus Omnitrophus magneticus]